MSLVAHLSRRMLGVTSQEAISAFSTDGVSSAREGGNFTSFSGYLAGYCARMWSVCVPDYLEYMQQ